jgi:hypothetical protein
MAWWAHDLARGMVRDGVEPPLAISAAAFATGVEESEILAVEDEVRRQGPPGSASSIELWHLVRQIDGRRRACP